MLKNFNKIGRIEKKWQKIWAEKKIYQIKDKVEGKKNYMLLTEFPYPSGNLHIGHWYAFAVPDIAARYMRMNGRNVMYPIGFDAFGLPAENAAIKRKTNPREWTEKNIKFMTKQLESMGAIFDWSRKISTIDPEYYKWTQWIFLKMYEKGLAYRAKTFANWCPSCKTVLANEQVIGGKCERCDSEVIQKKVEQWMFKITDYADRLIDDISDLSWPETTKSAQKNWIGRSEGASLKFKVKSEKLKSEEELEVFTTRIDTIFGCTYLVVAPEHSLIENLKLKIENFDEVKKYIEQARKKTDLQRAELAKEKTGVELKGIKAINPFNDEIVPVFAADYILGSYGTGAVMAVPAHDERDCDFAKKYKLPIRKVILPLKLDAHPQSIVDAVAVEGGDVVLRIESECWAGEGELVDSGQFTGMTSEEARREMIKWLEEKGLGESKRNYRLHDWVLSRQRYWGVPIPIIKCKKCGYVLALEKDLPVKLPALKDFLPTSKGKSPLAKAKKWVNVKCPRCKNLAQRETDTMDTFVDSSWYFIRYTDPRNKKTFADKKKMKQWLPVPMYVGGAEHNTMHLLYSRFFTKVLYDLGYIHFNEPFIARKNHGVILGTDGQKMSKSRGNIVDPDDLVKKFGSDTVRMYLCFMGPYDQGGPWQPNGILGIQRFLQRVYKKVQSKSYGDLPKAKTKLKVESRNAKSKNDKLERLLYKTIKKVTEDIENFRFNTAISALMILFNEIEHANGAPSPDGFGNAKAPMRIEILETFLKLLAPFAPHLSEELWQQLKAQSSKPKVFKSIFNESWPKYNPKLIKEEKIELVVQINGKVRDKVSVETGITQKEAEEIVLKLEKIRKILALSVIKKIIYVPDRLINVVV